MFYNNMGNQNQNEYDSKHYRIRYDEKFIYQSGVNQRPPIGNKKKVVKVQIDQGVVENIEISDNELTVGWLLSEINRRYDQTYSDPKGSKGHKEKKLIIGLKSIEGLLTLDHYLTNLDHVLAPIRHNTSLAGKFNL